MAIKKYKPTTPGRRGMSSLSFEEITSTSPERSLLEPLSKKGGRNNTGRITTRHQGGGHKRQYRVIDFKRNKDNIPAKVATIEYDPNRSANIALLNYADGEKRYILAPKGLQVGQTIVSGEAVDIKVGNAMELRNINTFLHIAELHSFSRTARQLGYSQSAVSSQIAQLEAELGAPLFDRVGKPITG